MIVDVFIRVLEFVKKLWVYIFGFIINLIGLFYSNKEMEKILLVCVKFGVRVLIDIFFLGLEYDVDYWDVWNLEFILVKLYVFVNLIFRVFLFGGLLVEMLIGGLVFGFLIVDKFFLVEIVNGFIGLSKFYSIMKYVMKKLLVYFE